MQGAVFRKIILGLCYLTAFALSIKSLREPDLWWQIRTGEWIIDNLRVPVTDIFSYTMYGSEWINIKWGFEVFAAFISGIAGPESVFVLQAMIALVIVYFFSLLTKVFGKNDFDVSAFAFALIITLIGAEYRINGRPEMMSHMFVCIFLYLLFTFNPANRKIYLLIPLQVLWANTHEAFGAGLVMIFIFTLSWWIVWFKDRKNLASTKKEALTLSLVLLLSTVSLLINPYGLKLLLRPLNIMSQVYENKFTTELFSFTNPLYWQKEAYIGLFILAAVGLAVYHEYRRRKKLQQKILVSGPELGYLITLTAFVYLAMTAYRNIVLFILLSFPLLYYSITIVFSKLHRRFGSNGKPLRVLALVCLSVFYILIVSNRFYELSGSRNNFGLEVLSNNNPVDAADWINQNGLKNKRCFSDYLTSSCLLWKLQPGFKTFIDLRDLDVFPQEFFQRFLTAVNYPEAFFKEDSVSKFDYVVLFRPQFKTLHSYLYNDSVYACKYVDAVAAVYEKTDSFSRGDIFSECRPVKSSNFSSAVNHILNPFYKPFDYRSINNDYIAASYYLDVFRYDLSKLRAEKIINRSKERDKGFELMGIINYEMAMRRKDSPEAAAFLDQSRDYYLEALRLNRENLNATTGLGQVFLTRGDYKSSLAKFERTLELDPENYNAFIMAAESSRLLMRQKRDKDTGLLKKSLNYFIKAEKLNPGNPYLLMNIGMLFHTMNNCPKATDYFHRIKDDPYLEVENRNAVLRYLRECEKK